MSDHELDAWHDFASEHYEMVEQYPLELHRNFRLLRELDDECAAQTAKLERLVRDYATNRLASTSTEDMLSEIGRLTREIVRNGEEKLAITVGAYNSVDRHIRVLDLATTSQGTETAGVEEDRAKKQDSSMEINIAEPVYCYCRAVSYGEMIACENDACPYEWFHLPCTELAEPPAGDWYCKTCMGTQTSRKKRRK